MLVLAVVALAARGLYPVCSSFDECITETNPEIFLLSNLISF